MTSPARHSTAKTSAHGAYSADEYYAPEELLAGERIGAPLPRNRGKALLKGSVALLIALGGGWALLADRTNWPSWPQAEIAAIFASMDRRVPGPAEPAAWTAPPAHAAPRTKSAIPDGPSPALQPPASNKAATTEGEAAKPAAPPLTTAALPPAAASIDDPSTAPLPPPTADPADPYQMRAAAVGLHPGLSRVLLARLSPADYRNAGFAIQSAMAQTSDSAVFVWPRQRKPEIAIFRVRFVPGAAAGCRRYVVTVAMDGWLTTALPMEKCGSKLGGARRG